MTEAELVRCELDSSVGVLRLVDEERRNALSYELRRQLVAGFYRLAGDPNVRALVLLGEGRAFCGGGDLQMMLHESDAWSAHLRLSRSGRWLTDLLRSPKPVVVGVNGAAVGGGIGLALCGDVIFAGAEQASFTAGFLRLGLIPDVGTMYTLPRAVGMTRANAFVFGGQTWSAAEAVEFGLVTEAVPDAELEARCMERAREFAAGPIEGIGLAKQLMARSYESSLDQMLTYEDLGQSVTYQTRAVREGVDAALARRRPDFVAASEREVGVRLDRRRATAPHE